MSTQIAVRLPDEMVAFLDRGCGREVSLDDVLADGGRGRVAGARLVEPIDPSRPSGPVGSASPS